MSENKKLKVAVIGAGIAGLSAAYTLKKGGADVVVYEADNRPGGRMYSRHKDGLTFDCGANFFVDAYETMKLYAHELGLEWISTLPGGSHRVIKDGKPHFYALAGLKDILRFDVLPFPERLKLIWFLVKLKTYYRHLNFFELYNQSERYDFSSAEEYLEKTVGRNAVDYIADPFTAIMQFHRSDDISVAGLLALFDAMTRQRNTTFNIRYTKGGIDEIPQALAKKLDVKYNTSVEKVENTPAGVNVTTPHSVDSFDIVIMATTADAANTITGNKYAKDVFDEVRYAKTIALSYKISVEAFSDNAHINYVPKVENEIISGYGNEMRKGDDIRNGDITLLTVYLHETAAETLLRKSDGEIFDVVSSELPKVCPELHHSSFEPHDLQRWEYAMPKFSHPYVTTASNFLHNEQGKDNIYFVGDYLAAPWTEGAARLGKKTAENILNGKNLTG